MNKDLNYFLGNYKNESMCQQKNEKIMTRKAKSTEISQNVEISKNHPKYSYRIDYKMFLFEINIYII